MRQLHVVSLSEDGRFVLLAPSRNAGSGTFRVALDARLVAAVRGELPRPGESAPPASSVTPKEIQARLRAGESVEDIARSAGVPAARVERFAGPVVSERARIIEAARAAVLHRSRRGASAVPLGEAVDAHLAQTAGLEAESVTWTARRAEEGDWVVEVAFCARGRRRRASWSYDPAGRELSPVDASSSVLGFVDPEDGDRPGKVVAAARPGPARRRRPPRRPTASVPRSAAAARVPAAARTAPAATGSRAGAGRPGPATASAGPAASRPVKAATTARPTKAATAAPAATTARPTKAATAAPAATTAKATKAAPGRAAAKAPGRAAKAAPGRAAKAAPGRAAKAARAQEAAKAPAAATTAKRAHAGAAKAVPAADAATAAPAAKAAKRPRAATGVRPAAAGTAAGAGTAAPARTTAAGREPGPPQLRVVPDPEAPSRRASVPAWADVLLSTTPPARTQAPPAEDED